MQQRWHMRCSVQGHYLRCFVRALYSLSPPGRKRQHSRSRVAATAVPKVGSSLGALESRTTLGGSLILGSDLRGGYLRSTAYDVRKQMALLATSQAAPSAWPKNATSTVCAIAL